MASSVLENLFSLSRVCVCVSLNFISQKLLLTQRPVKQINFIQRGTAATLLLSPFILRRPVSKSDSNGSDTIYSLAAIHADVISALCNIYCATNSTSASVH